MFLCGFFVFFCFWTHAEADSRVIAHFRAPPNREEKENQHHSKGEGKSNTTQSGCGAFPFAHRAACTSSSFGLWRLRLWAGAAFLCLLLGGSRKKKTPAQRAHGTKHHFPNEGEAKHPHSQGSGEEGSTTQKEREKSNTTQSGWWCFPPSLVVLLPQPFVGETKN